MAVPSSPIGTFRLFVYGTLKRGGVRHGPLARQRFLGEAATTPRYALLDLGAYPGLIAASENGTVVRGELYEVDSTLVGWLDAVEGAPDLYRLDLVELASHTGVVWAYFYQGDAQDCPRVSSGNWVHPSGETRR